MKTQRQLIDKLKRDDIIVILDEYYKKIGRTQTPNYREYALQELKKCIVLHGIQLTEE